MSSAGSLSILKSEKRVNKCHPGAEMMTCFSFKYTTACFLLNIISVFMWNSEVFIRLRKKTILNLKNTLYIAGNSD